MLERIIALEIGGACVKHAVFERGQIVKGSMGRFAINAQGAADDIFKALYAYLDRERAQIVCVCMPGPMDYLSGTSRMDNKLKGLNGVPMKARFEARYPGARFMFANNDAAFLAGVMRLGDCDGAHVPAGITLGTGLGFAFAERGQVMINDSRTPCFPLGNAPFRDGVCEDYVSGRAISAAYARRAEESVDVKQIALRARAGDPIAVAVFADAGRALGDMIQDRARRLSIDRVILGGQISKSADLFLPYARERADVCILPTSHPDDAALHGAFALTQNEDSILCRAFETALPYGEGEQLVHMHPSRVRAILAPASPDACSADDEHDAQTRVIQTALENPISSARLRDIARGKKRVLVITSDHTRPVPSKLTLPPLLAEIRAGNPGAEIVILIATGMHRASTPDEIRAKFGEHLCANEKFENHDCRDHAHMIDMGTLPSGGALKLNDRLLWADLVVAEGFIEPHFFAGFSGGRKSILPGIASEETVRYNHNSRFISSPGARQGVLDGNPIHTDMRFAAKQAKLKFILNVLLDANKRVIAAVAGDCERAHAAGCALCLEYTGVEKREADVVITTNGGYPLDQNIYQAVKGMTAAEACVRNGGAIVMLSECVDGVGGDSFFNMLASAPSPGKLLESALDVPPERTPADQWEAQILARVLSRANVYMVTHPKNREAVERMHMRYAQSADEAVRSALKAVGGSVVTIIPDGVGVIIKS